MLSRYVLDVPLDGVTGGPVRGREYLRSVNYRYTHDTELSFERSVRFVTAPSRRGYSPQQTVHKAAEVSQAACRSFACKRSVVCLNPRAGSPSRECCHASWSSHLSPRQPSSGFRGL